MKFVLVTKDEEVLDAAKAAFGSGDDLKVFEDWELALDKSKGADIMFVDLIATLDEPNRIAGYERFALAKMAHPSASSIPLILISPPLDYDIDAMMGWPDFLLAQMRRPVDEKRFRRAATWV